MQKIFFDELIKMPDNFIFLNIGNMSKGLFNLYIKDSFTIPEEKNEQVNKE